LKTGDWIGTFSGANEEHRVVPKVIAMAYNPDGTPKRSVGFWYPDIKTVWTKEMELKGKSIETIKRHRSTTKLSALTDKLCFSRCDERFKDTNTYYRNGNDCILWIIDVHFRGKG
jgi:hypothetical protein